MTHWKKLHNPDYIGAYALDDGKDLIVTIKRVEKTHIKDANGKTEEVMLMHFKETGVKPMVLNVTNAKTIEKLYKTPHIEEWSGKQIQLYVARVSAFGEKTDALRIRDFAPVAEKEEDLFCDQCEKKIKGKGGLSASVIASESKRKYDKQLCLTCAVAAKEAAEEDADVRE